MGRAASATQQGVGRGLTGRCEVRWAGRQLHFPSRGECLASVFQNLITLVFIEVFLNYREGTV